MNFKKRLRLSMLSFVFLTSCNANKNIEDFSLYIKAREIITDNDEYEIFVNQQYKIEVDIKPSNFSASDIQFKTTDTKIATVSKNGIVTGKSIGKCDLIIFVGDNEENADCKKIIPINVIKEDRNKQKDGLIEVQTQLDLSDILTNSFTVDDSNYNDSDLLVLKKGVRAPLVKTYNTNDNGFIDLSKRIKLLHDIDYYGTLSNESSSDRGERIYDNMQFLYVTSLVGNQIFDAVGSADAYQYKNYADNISTNYKKMLYAKLGIPYFTNLFDFTYYTFPDIIDSTPAQHNVIYLNDEYFAEAKTQVTSKSTSCNFYDTFENNLSKADIISSVLPLLNFLNVKSIRENLTKENVDKALNDAKKYFATLPVVDSTYYQILKILVSSLDENSYTIETTTKEDIGLTEEENNLIGSRDATEIRFVLTDSGIEAFKKGLVDFLDEKITITDENNDKVKLKNYIKNAVFSEISLKIICVDRKEGSGIDIYKIRTNLVFTKKGTSEDNDKEQYLKTTLTYSFDEVDIDQNFFSQEEERQIKYKEEATSV